MTKSVYFV